MNQRAALGLRRGERSEREAGGKKDGSGDECEPELGFPKWE
jgi:hypothetical protein